MSKEPTSIKEVNKAIGELRKSVQELKEKLVVSTINKVGKVKGNDDNVFYAVQGVMKVRGGSGPSSRIVCRNDGNSWLYEVRLAHFSANSVQSPIMQNIVLSRGDMYSIYALVCPVCNSLILSYDPNSDLVNPNDWADLVEELRDAVMRIKRGEIGEYSTKKPHSRRRRNHAGGSFIAGSGLETF